MAYESEDESSRDTNGVPRFGSMCVDERRKDFAASASAADDDEGISSGE